LRQVAEVIIWLKAARPNVVQSVNEFLKLKEYTNNDDCPCVFIKKFSTGFCIISVYVNDLNIIGNGSDINEARHHLKTSSK